MLKISGFRLGCVVGVGCLLLGLQACTPPAQALKPVAQQNQKNLQALSENTQLLLALYEPLLKASGNALIYQHIGKLQQEVIAVVGPPTLPAPPADKSWESLFEASADSFMGKQEKYHERYRFVRSALERGLDAEDTRKLQRNESWIYTAANDPGFTPRKAHELLKSLMELRRSGNVGESAYFREAEIRLLPYDPTLKHYRATIETAETLMEGLKSEIVQGLNNARLHGQALLNYTESKIQVQDALHRVDNEQILQVLEGLSERYIKNSAYREAAVTLLHRTIVGGGVSEGAQDASGLIIN